MDAPERAALVLNTVGPAQCLCLGSVLGGKMPFWACAWKCSLGPEWSADVRGVCSVVTGTGCPGVGGTAPGKPNLGDDPKGSPGSAPECAPDDAPRGGELPGHAHHCHSCLPLPTPPSRERSAALTVSEQAAKIPESALSPPGSHKLQGRRRSPLNQMLLRASSANRQFRTKRAISQQGRVPHCSGGSVSPPCPCRSQPGAPSSAQE